MKRTFVAICGSLSLAAQAETIDPDMVFDRPQGTRDDAEVYLHAGWESRYVSEGRDNLDGDGLITGTVEAGWKFLSLGAWYANSPDDSYDELQLSAALTKTWGDFEAYLAYTHLRFPSDNFHDHEIGVGAAWSGIPYGLILAIDSYYSIDAEGAFIELICGGDYELNECLTLSPALTFGVNQGYISDGHDGTNHIAVTLGAEYAFTGSFAALAHIAYNFALERDNLRAGDATLRNFLHTGVGLSWSF